MPPMKPAPLALQLYTVREQMAKDWRAVLRRVAEIGYLGVECAGFSHAPAADTRAYCEELGLQIVATHAPLPLGEQQQAALDLAAALGCSRLICAGTGPEFFLSRQKLMERAVQFNAANAIARAHGLTFGLHNHWWEFNAIDGQPAFDLLLAELDDDIFFEVDVYWAETAGISAVNLIQKLGPRAPLLHIKDGPATLEASMTAVGQGALDFHQIIPAGQPHTQWLIVELDRCDGDMMTAVAESYRYLTEQGLGRGRV